MTVLFQRLVERKALLSGDVRREYFDSSNWTEESHLPPLVLEGRNDT